MRKEEIVAVIIRLFGIALGLYAISRLPSWAMYLHENQSEDPSYLILFGVSGLLVFVAVALWKFSMFFARQLVSKEQGEMLNVAWATTDVLETGFILLGVYFAYDALSDLFYWIFVWMLADNYLGQDLTLEAEQWANIYTTIIEMMIVIGLIFGARGLANFIRMLRYAGQEK